LKVREVFPGWRPTSSAYNTVEGYVASIRAEAEQAEARVVEFQRNGILPGQYAGESIPARSRERDFWVSERREGNRIGSDTGCHTCGRTSPETPSGNFVLDHQIPTALNPLGRPQWLYPQCLSCSLRQGGWITGNTRPQ
jgi:hypothetical protein